jgi:hypothetical protein
MHESDIINENDEELHDEIVFKIAQKTRDTSSLPAGMMETVLWQIEGIVEHLSCSICMEIVNNPYVIKHCLHFFCKECIDTSMRQL